MNEQISRKITVTLEREYESREIEVRQLILRKGRSETSLHVVLKLLAYLYFWNSSLIIEPKFRFRKYKPDLISFRTPEIPVETNFDINQWVECKHVKIEKLIKLGRILPHSDIFWFHKFDILRHNLNNILSKRKWNLTSNIHLIGVKIKRGIWDMLQSSLFVNPPNWKFIRFEKEVISIYLDENKDSEFLLRFHHF